MSIKENAHILLSQKGAESNSKLATSDRGDVPGWVLITLMTAALVVVIWSLAAPALSQVFDQAMNKVVSF
jgi:hypothetical protein